MLLQEVPVAKYLLDHWQSWILVLDCLNQIFDAFFAMLTFNIDVEALDIFDVAHALGVKEDFILELNALCVGLLLVEDALLLVFNVVNVKIESFIDVSVLIIAVLVVIRVEFWVKSLLI